MLRANRSFGLTLGGALIVIGVVMGWRGAGPAAAVGAVGVALAVTGLLLPGVLSRVRATWMALGNAISKVTTPIVLGVVYFVIVTPLGAIMRLFGRNPLRRRLQDGSYWASVPSGGRSDLDNQF